MGVESAGFPATVSSPRIRFSPAASISSASAAAGSSPPNSGRSRTVERQRAYGILPSRRRRSRPGPAAARGNIAPPSRSRLPVSTLTASTSQLASVPNSCVQVPIRP